MCGRRRSKLITGFVEKSLMLNDRVGRLEGLESNFGGGIWWDVGMGTGEGKVQEGAREGGTKSERATGRTRTRWWGARLGRPANARERQDPGHPPCTGHSPGGLLGWVARPQARVEPPGFAIGCTTWSQSANGLAVLSSMSCNFGPGPFTTSSAGSC